MRRKAPVGVYNFRSEGSEFASGRCLIPADGFYEFTESPDKKKKRKDKWVVHEERRALVLHVGGGENPRLDGASSLSGWDNVRRIGVDARVACASSLSMSAYVSWGPGPLGLAWADAGRMAG